MITTSNSPKIEDERNVSSYSLTSLKKFNTVPFAMLFSEEPEPSLLEEEPQHVSFTTLCCQQNHKLKF